MSDDVIAIDGPAASGKSTVAKRVAAKLDRLYVDSGALYRGVTWKLLDDNQAPLNAECINRAAGLIDFDVYVSKGAVRFRIDGVDPGPALRSTDVDSNVSLVAADPGIRRLIVGTLRAMAGFGKLVMEGRDIGTAVFPEARHKFYLDASPEERARRRHAELKGEESTVEKVSVALGRRDSIDSSRKVDPLKTAPDAHVVDTTGLSINQVVSAVLAVILGNPDNEAGS